MSAVLADTNVLVYATDSREGRKHEVAKDVLRRLGRTRIAISTQVLSEYANVLTHPRKQALPAGVALAYVHRMTWSLRVIPLDKWTVIAALGAVDLWGTPYYDAQIWAVAAQNQIPVVLSEDFSSGAILGPVRFVNPFTLDFELAMLD